MSTGGSIGTPFVAMITGNNELHSAEQVNLMEMPEELMMSLQHMPELTLKQLSAFVTEMSRSSEADPAQTRALLEALKKVHPDAYEVLNAPTAAKNVYFDHVSGTAVKTEGEKVDAPVPTAAQATFDHPRAHESTAAIASVLGAAKGIPYTQLTNDGYELAEIPLRDVMAMRRDLDHIAEEEGAHPNGVVVFTANEAPRLTEDSAPAARNTNGIVHTALCTGTFVRQPEGDFHCSTEAIYNFSDHAMNTADQVGRLAAKHVAHEMAKDGLKRKVSTEAYAARLESDAFRQAAAAVNNHGTPISGKTLGLVQTAAAVRAGTFDGAIPGLAKKLRGTLKGKTGVDDVVAHLSATPTELLARAANSESSLVIEDAAPTPTAVIGTAAPAPHAFNNLGAMYGADGQSVVAAHRELIDAKAGILSELPKRSMRAMQGAATIDGKQGTAIMTVYSPTVATTTSDGRTLQTTSRLVHGVFFPESGITKAPTHFHTNGFTESVNGAEVASIQTLVDGKASGTGLLALKQADDKLHFTIAAN